MTLWSDTKKFALGCEQFKRDAKGGYDRVAGADCKDKVDQVQNELERNWNQVLDAYLAHFEKYPEPVEAEVDGEIAVEGGEVRGDLDSREVHFKAAQGEHDRLKDLIRDKIAEFAQLARGPETVNVATNQGQATRLDINWKAARDSAKM